jgi:hypothetical protein
VNREELEALIWQHMPGLASSYAPDRYAAMNAVLGHIDDYTTAQCVAAITSPDLGEQATRRGVLEAATRPKRTHRPLPPLPPLDGPPVHWQKPAAATGTAACKGRAASPVTTDYGLVTCGSCVASAAWRKAAA